MQKKLFIVIGMLLACSLFTTDTEAQLQNGCGPGACLGGSFCDDCLCYAPESDVSRAFCECGLLDPSCGVGECLGDSYCDGPNCPLSGVCWAENTPQSQVMCGGASLNEECEVVEERDCGPGACLGDSFCDSCACYAPESNISKLFCQCELLDPACGLGECVGSSYCEGPHCPGSGVCYIPTSPISLGMCGGVILDDRCDPIPRPECVTPPADMHCWWPLDETLGTRAADIIGGHHGTHQNGPVPATGMVASALHFDGLDDYVVAPGNGGHTYINLTIDAWIKPDVIGPGQSIVDYGPDVYGLILEGDELRFYTQLYPASYATISTDVNFQAGVWTHVAVTADSTTGSILSYVDGNLVNVFSGYIANRSFNSPDYNWQIGGVRSGATYLFDGLIDEVEIFERALSQAEIQSIVNAGPAGKCKAGL